MTQDHHHWNYNEYLAFMLVYCAEMNMDLSAEELEYIKQKTGIKHIDKIKEKVESLSDIEAIEIIDDFKKEHLTTPEKQANVRKQMEELLHTGGKHTQLESVLVHILKRLV